MFKVAKFKRISKRINYNVLVLEDQATMTGISNNFQKDGSMKTEDCLMIKESLMIKKYLEPKLNCSTRKQSRLLRDPYFSTSKMVKSLKQLMVITTLILKS